MKRQSRRRGITLSRDRANVILHRDSRSLKSALAPRSVAIIGASDHPNKVGGRPILYLSRFGFRGKVFPINPNRTHVQGLKAYPELSALPEAPDVAVVAVPRPHVAGAIDACADCGVEIAVVMTSGFAETANDVDVAAQGAMVARAQASGMRIVGPNSQGLANFATGAVLSFSTMFLEVEPADGPVAVISQSGIMSAVPYGLLRRRGIGVRHVHATGNDADVGLPELAAAVVQDPGVRLLLMYMETVRDPDQLAHVAQLARERDIPIVAVKAGRTARGHAAARSHTVALAADDRVVDAFFRTHGIWRADDIEDLVGAAELYLAGWRPRGRRLVVLSNSGASCVMAADSAEVLDLPLARLDDRTVAAISAELPAFATTTNPVDITAALLTNSRLFSNLLPILAEDSAAELFMIHLPVVRAGYDVDAFARDTASFAANTGKPVVVAAPQENVIERFRHLGVPTFANQTDAMHSLAQLATHVARMCPPVTAWNDVTVRLPAGSGPFLNEAESLDILRTLGLPTTPYRLCQSETEAVDAFLEFGGPVAVKGCSSEATHKSELGLVMLGVGSAIAVATAFRALQRRLDLLRLRNDGIIVAPMAEGRRELVIGAGIDPVFGPVITVGDGGKYVEVLADSALLLPPFSVGDVERALSTLRIAPILRGVRGEPPLDIEALCDTVVRLGEIATGAIGRIAALDLNPVMTRSAGEGVTIVDALIERAESVVTHAC